MATALIMRIISAFSAEKVQNAWPQFCLNFAASWCRVVSQSPPPTNPPTYNTLHTLLPHACFSHCPLHHTRQLLCTMKRKHDVLCGHETAQCLSSSCRASKCKLSQKQNFVQKLNLTLTLHTKLASCLAGLSKMFSSRKSCKKLNYSVSAVGKLIDLQIGCDAAKVVAEQCDYSATISCKTSNATFMWPKASGSNLKQCRNFKCRSVHCYSFFSCTWWKIIFTLALSHLMSFRPKRNILKKRVAGRFLWIPPPPSAFHDSVTISGTTTSTVLKGCQM